MPASWTLGKSDPLIGDALRTVLDRDDFIRSLPDEGPAWAPPGAGPAPIETDPAIVAELIGRERRRPSPPEARHRRSPDRSCSTSSEANIQELKRDPVRLAEHAGDHGGDGGHVVAQRTAAGVAGREERGGHAHAVRPQQRHLGDGAGAPRRRRRDPPASGRGRLPADLEDDDFLEELPTLAGGPEARDAILAYLDEYGMRCVGEIDITRPRWSERPITLVPMILTTSGTSSRAPARGASSRAARRR